MIGLPASTPRGKPEDIASLVSFLAKPESRFLTGELPFFVFGMRIAVSRFGRIRSWNGAADIFFLVVGQTITMDGGWLGRVLSEFSGLTFVCYLGVIFD